MEFEQKEDENLQIVEEKIFSAIYDSAVAVIKKVLIK